MARKLDLMTKPEKCERGCGETVAVTRRRDDGATRLSTIRGGDVMPGDHGGVYHGDRDRGRR